MGSSRARGPPLASRTPAFASRTLSFASRTLSFASRMLSFASGARFGSFSGVDPQRVSLARGLHTVWVMTGRARTSVLMWTAALSVVLGHLTLDWL